MKYIYVKSLDEVTERQSLQVVWQGVFFQTLVEKEAEGQSLKTVGSSVSFQSLVE